MGERVDRQRVAYFYERADAEEALRQLSLEGVDVHRERFQGEDDDEDHPWAVVLPSQVDADLAAEVVEQYDGWLAPLSADPAPASPSPAPLPTAPRRLKRG